MEAKTKTRWTFVITRRQVMKQACTDTNRIVMFDPHNGAPIYYRECHDTGLVWVETTPEPITVPTELAVGIVVGAVMDYEAKPGRVALPTAVYADKSKARLVAYLGFPL